MKELIHKVDRLTEEMRDFLGSNHIRNDETTQIKLAGFIATAETIRSLLEQPPDAHERTRL